MQECQTPNGRTYSCNEKLTKIMGNNQTRYAAKHSVLLGNLLGFLVKNQNKKKNKAKQNKIPITFDYVKY